MLVIFHDQADPCFRNRHLQAPFLWQFNTIHGAVFCKLLKQLVETQKSRLSPRIPKQPHRDVLQPGEIYDSVAVKVPFWGVVNPDSLSIVFIACST
ncbi:hypothetical protein NIA69_10975 [Gemmiger formicilis]|nr:hypothetical protein [Gemmiger formicilis]